MYRIWDNYHEVFLDDWYVNEDSAWEVVNRLCKLKKAKGEPYDYDVR